MKIMNIKSTKIKLNLVQLAVNRKHYSIHFSRSLYKLTF